MTGRQVSPRAEARTDPADYSGAERAAIAMLSLGPVAADLMRLLHADEIREISTAMSSLGAVPADVVEAVMSDFLVQVSRAGCVVGTIEHTERILSSVLPNDRVHSIVEELRGPVGRNVWDKLGSMNQTVLASYLANESPQTAAVVLSKLPVKIAAGVLAVLPHDFALRVTERMLIMEPVHRDVLQHVEASLRQEFVSNLNRTRKRDNHEAMAEIFNNLDRQTERRFLSIIEAKAQLSAERIRALMFVFDDLSMLDAGGVQTLLRSIDKRDLAMALKGASESMQQLFLRNMSERGAKLLREDIHALGAVRLREVEAAQSRIVALAKDLSERGDLLLGRGVEEDELVY
jgi:flagellar motor switch protein FliG